MPELALDDVDRHSFARSSARAAVAPRRRPRVGPSMTQNRGQGLRRSSPRSSLLIVPRSAPLGVGQPGLQRARLKRDRLVLDGGGDGAHQFRSKT
jgi:hypothetical protein